MHTHHSQPDDVIAILNVDPEAYKNESARFVSIGIHPWYIQEYDVTDIIEKIKIAAGSENVKAIGESGLDRLAETPMKVQETVFIKQIEIAEACNKPLIIHCVKAFDELIRIKKEQQVKTPMIIHGYNNNEQIAEQLIKNGFYLSFGKALLNENSNAQMVIKKLSWEQLFLETDNSDLSINDIYEKAAALKNISVEELKEKMMLNFKNTFSL